MIHTAKRNRRFNKELEGLPEKYSMINGQGIGAASKFRYGVKNMESNGCECIAVYNALIYLRKPQPLNEIAFFMERYKLVFGVFGCNPHRLGKILGRFGAAFERKGDIASPGAYIISFWTGKPFFSQIHTIFCTVEKNAVCAFNRYNNNSAAVIYGNAEELLKNKTLIAAYLLLESGV